MDKLAALDLLLYAAHLAMVLFVLTGWMFRPLRRAHLILIALIWLSWIGLGIYMGHMGYCPLTDWHWQIKTARGETGLPLSFVEYVYRQMTGQDVNDRFISGITALAMVIATFLSLCVNLKRKG